VFKLESSPLLTNRGSLAAGWKVSAPVKGILGALVIAGSGSLYAQEPAEPEAARADRGDEMVVTGSRVARTGYDTPTPVTVIDEAAILSAPSPNISDFVNQLPSIAGSTQPSTSNRAVSSGAAGINSVNLRNLGNARTLVLLDGQRSVGSLAQGTVDTNTFPQGLIRSVEIVTGGASATYGSDAVSGVVNFILDRNYTGVKGSIEAGETTYGDDRNWTTTLTGGTPFASGRGHALFNAQYSQRDGVYGNGSREWTQQGWHLINNPAYAVGNGAPEFITSPNSGRADMTPGGIITAGPLRGTYFGADGAVNQFAYGPTASNWTVGGDWRLGVSSDRTSLEPEARRGGLFTRMSYELTNNLETFVQVSWNQVRARQWAGTHSDKGGITIQADNAFIPESVRQQLEDEGLTSFTMGSHNADIPTRESDNTRTVQRYVVGLEGSFDAFNHDWRWDAYYQKGITRAHEELYTYNTARLREAQDAVFDGDGNIVCRSGNPDCVPFNRMGIGVNEQSAVDYIMGTPMRRQQFEQDVAAVNFTTSLHNVPWFSPIGFAFGLEHRRESIDGQVDPQYQSGWSVGNYLATSGKYDVTEGYLEILVPLLDNLEFNSGVRGTDYSTSGFVTTWKAGLTWDVTQELRLRAVKSRDIRAPNLEELYQAGRQRTNFLTDFEDPAQPSVRFQESVTGNLDLKPEEADSLGLGLVYRPSFAPGLGISVDYYDIEIKDAISMVTAQEIVRRCHVDNNPTFCGALTKFPAFDPTLVYFVANNPFNFVSERARGLDFEVSYPFHLDDLVSGWQGQVRLRALATHFIERSSDDGVSGKVDTAGENTSAGGPPDWRYRMSAAYNLDRFTFVLTGRGLSSGTYNNRWVGCTADCPPTNSTNRTIASNKIKGALYWDTYFAWDLDFFGGGNSQIFFNINNVFNTDPEVVGLGPSDSSNVEVGTNRGLYDYLGRTFRIGLRFDFGV
jgi:iron complex outermembrane receptor protein